MGSVLSSSADVGNVGIDFDRMDGLDSCLPSSWEDSNVGSSARDILGGRGGGGGGGGGGGWGSKEASLSEG